MRVGWWGTTSNDSIACTGFSGAPAGMCAFRDSTADRIKLIFWDGTGLVLYAKRLEEGVAAVRKYRLRSHPVIRWGAA